MDYTKDISVIIPHRDSVQYLPQLLSTIPKSERVEILIVDNSVDKLTMDKIDTDRQINILYSEPERGAGGARNVGMEHAQGKWLIFADADDYFHSNAFAQFYDHLDSVAELIYFTAESVYQDTKENSDRGQYFVDIVHDYLYGSKDELRLRLCFASPCCKMVSHALVDRHQLRYDEVPASNDKYFSMLTGYYATSIEAVDAPVYVMTITQGSLTHRHDFASVLSRLKVIFRYNQFLRAHGLGKYQQSMLNYFIIALQARPYAFPYLLWLLVRFQQNPLIGVSRWFKTAKHLKEKRKTEKEKGLSHQL